MTRDNTCNITIIIIQDEVARRKTSRDFRRRVVFRPESRRTIACAVSKGCLKVERKKKKKKSRKKYIIYIYNALKHISSRHFRTTFRSNKYRLFKTFAELTAKRLICYYVHCADERPTQTCRLVKCLVDKLPSTYIFIIIIITTTAFFLFFFLYFVYYCTIRKRGPLNTDGSSIE